MFFRSFFGEACMKKQHFADERTEGGREKQQQNAKRVESLELIRIVKRVEVQPTHKSSFPTSAL